MGYRRTGSNIFKTRSNKKMTSLVSKTMAYGMMAPFAALDSMSSSGHSSYIPGEPKHYSSKKHKLKIIICGILALLCPIAGLILFVIPHLNWLLYHYLNWGLYYDWYMFFSVTLFGFIELLVFMIALDDEVTYCLENSSGGIIYSHVYKYIYKDEFDSVSKEYCKNLNIIIRIMIVTSIINLYPFILAFLGLWGLDFGSEITFILALLVVILNILFIIVALKNKKYKDVWEIRKRPKTEEKSSANSNSKSHNYNDKTNLVNKRTESNNGQQSDVDVSNLTIPKINGEYTEEFMDNYGTLRIGSTHAQIEFYFPGPDARYKGTFISIQENEIDKYINAYKNNWKTAEELQKKVLGTNTEFKCGEMDMNIIVSQNSIELCLSHYKLPIYSKEECDDIINHFNIAKYRIKEIRQKLFDK
jgi:uncharacterized membrane protein